MTPAQFDIKNEGDLPAVTPDKPFDAILKVSNDAIISQPQQVVKGDSKNSSEEMKQSRLDADYLAADESGDTETTHRNKIGRSEAERSRILKNQTVRG